MLGGGSADNVQLRSPNFDETEMENVLFFVLTTRDPSSTAAVFKPYLFFYKLEIKMDDSPVEATRPKSLLELLDLSNNPDAKATIKICVAQRFIPTEYVMNIYDN
jgi:hypothetical protein